jgi:ABC-type transport system involved in Fe-S cluster assembly, permease component
MSEMERSNVQKILKTVADLEGTPKGAYNIRVDGKSAGRASTKNIEIRSKEDGQGIEVHIQPGTKGEFVHIPVVIESSGYAEVVYNDFYIGDDSDIEIIAGCGIHNDGYHLSQHDGIHTFHVGKNSRVKYLEKHYGEGGGDGQNVLNPVTVVHLAENSYLEMNTMQIEGVDSTERETMGDLADGATLVVKEKLMTSGKQHAITKFKVDLNGAGSSTNIVSRSVAKGDSYQEFLSEINGNNACAGHSECDAIIMDSACVKAIPEITANHVDASLIHEAAIGKIAGEQIIKLMTLGLSQEEAEREIVNGFLK